MKKSALLAATLVVMTAQAQYVAAIIAPDSSGGIEQELTALNDALLRDLAVDIGRNTPKINRVVIGTERGMDTLSGTRLHALEDQAIRRLTSQVTVEELGANPAASGTEFSTDELSAQLKRANAELTRQLSAAFSVDFYLDHEAQHAPGALRQACAC